VKSASAALEKNAFEIDNARNQYERQLPETFVPTAIYWRMFTEKNQILVGTRGSGKTAILKMLTLPYIVHFEDPDVRSMLRSRRFIGVYVPVSTLWLGPVKFRTWANSEEKSREFLWRFSIAACQALTRTVEGCLDTYLPSLNERLVALANIIKRLCHLWFPGQDANSISSLGDLRERLGELPLKKNLFDAAHAVNPYLGSSEFDQGLCFYSPVLDSFIAATNIVQRVLGLEESSSSWLVCLDEVETLDPELQIIINTFMRSDFGNRYFKIATLPYAHRTLKTHLDSSLQTGHDFEYLWIDEDPASQENSLRGAVSAYSSWTFARALYNKRRLQSGGVYSKHSLDRLLGKDSLLSPISLLSEDAPGAEGAALATFRRLAEAHFNEPTLQRARSMTETLRHLSSKEAAGSRFGDQMLRKTLGFLLLRDAYARKSGAEKLAAFSGAEMVVRLADGNARTLIRLINALLRNTGYAKNRSAPVIPRRYQHETLTRFSESVLSRTKSEEEFGPALYELINRIGSGLARMFHQGKVGSDLTGQVQFDVQQFARHRHAIELGVQLGLLRVDLRPGTDFSLPVDHGVFRLSYVLTPAFRLMPRRGRVSSLATVVGASQIEHPVFTFGSTA
jgi:hypothetical protein